MNALAPRIIVEPVSFAPRTGAVIALAGRRREPAVLDSAAEHPRYGRYTIVTCEPVITYCHRAGDGDPFEAMRGHLAASDMLEPTTATSDLPFAGGWIGYFAYEAGRFIERLPARTRADVGLPLARFALYDSAAVYDHVLGRWSVVAAEIAPAGAGRCDLRARLAWWKDLLRSALDADEGKETGISGLRARHAGRPPYGPVTHNLSRDEHLRIVQRGRQYIAAGDIFQVNLARRESIPATENPLDLYLRLRRTNPGMYSAFLSWHTPNQSCLPSESPGAGVCAVLSSSPELFLDLQGQSVITRPIKGTRPRSADPAVDASLRQELAASPKDRAELAMIVDLERNDLGRVCEFGSVRVQAGDSPAAPFELEAHPTVHHLVATVTGRLAPGRDAIDLLRATFPGGSITGAPKVRAMEIIDELEPTERSVYTGAIGLFAPGRMIMNIAIRTILQARDMLHWYAGGGIVADSDPAAEYDETCAKLLGMRRAVGIEDTPATAGR
ncbi:MAG TPA: anthranilate synthase component I family protein [Phycisphaerae bacterium]|nr:anthranilate synthase component I family protein [Phycisphaerae bacterium]HOJ73605.1 anthranilate synthase component I family protein [Phycisphaerae bacterium]HOM51586.1 anthranilate synthase component I family protein [Phycisphaerae bacterium]HOQ85764.1 anthranilate synthase component I family protein [Phycisphaerae bacterium]HPP25558.1 anthranilate synthase component I family protein [Phycisphaerae bacterium]